MVLNDRKQIRDLLRETVTMLCKRGLTYNAQLSVEGLLGITVDDNEVFLVNIKETVQNPTSLSPSRGQQELTESMPSSAEDSPLMGDSHTDIVSRAVTPMHTFRSSGFRKQRSRKRTWGLGQGDVQSESEAHLVHLADESSSTMKGPPQKQQIVGSAPLITAVPADHSIIKQEHIQTTTNEEHQLPQSQNFDNSIASNSFDSADQQEEELSPMPGVEGSQQWAACKLPLSVASDTMVEPLPSQSDGKSPEEVLPGCSTWTEPVDGAPPTPTQSHLTPVTVLPSRTTTTTTTNTASTPVKTEDPSCIDPTGVASSLAREPNISLYGEEVSHLGLGTTAISGVIHIDLDDDDVETIPEVSGQEYKAQLNVGHSGTLSITDNENTQAAWKPDVGSQFMSGNLVVDVMPDKPQYHLELNQIQPEYYKAELPVSAMLPVQQLQVQPPGDSVGPCTCNVCGKRLSSPYGLQRHQDRHRGIYPHTCQYCGKGFSSHYNLRGHLVTHTNVKEFKCNMCTAQYVYKQDLHKHMAKKHNVIIVGN